MEDTRISVDTLKDAIAKYELVIEDTWNGIPVKIKKHLSLADTMSFTAAVVDMCFNEDTGEYRPEIKDFLIRSAIVEYYTNLTLPSDIKERYEMVHSCDIVSFVFSKIEKNHFNAMLDAIDKRIANRAQSNIEALTMQMNQLISGFEQMEKGMSGLFGGVDSDTINQLASAIANGTFDESKIVDAVMQQKNMASGA